MNARRYKWLIIIFSRKRHIRQVEDEVPHLSEELILIDVPLGPGSAGNVRVRVKKSDTDKVITAFNRRWIVRVADELCIIELYDGRADSVLAGREVHDGALNKCVATLTAASFLVATSRRLTPATHGRVNSFRGIGLTLLVGSKISNITIELVSTAGERCL